MEPGLEEPGEASSGRYKAGSQGLTRLSIWPYLIVTSSAPFLCRNPTPDFLASSKSFASVYLHVFDRECMVAFCVGRLAVPTSCATGSADDLEVIGDPWQFSEVSLSVLGGLCPFSAALLPLCIAF